MTNSNEDHCLKNAEHFTAVRGRAAKDRIKAQFKTMHDAEEFASSFGDGRTMIYAVCIDGRSAHIRNA